MDDLISIVIPMYNAQEFIAKLLDSILSQTYKKFEVVIVNDGSTDNSLNIVNEYAKKDNRIKVITTPNGGVSRARNIGLQNITGKYFSFLDADDYIEKDMYEKIVDAMKKYNTDVIRCNYKKEDGDFNYISQGNMLDLSNKVIGKEAIKNKIIPYMFENKIEAYTPLIFAKSELLKKVKPFNEDIHMMEDLLFYLDLLLNIENIYFLDCCCYHYIFRSSSNSKRRDKLMRNLNDTLKVVNIVENFLEENSFTEKVYDQVHYIYSTMIVKYILRTFQKEDEYKLSYEKMKELLSSSEIIRIIKNVNFPDTNIYIKTAGELIQNKEYNKLYNYGIEISNIQI